ncbi:MAG TPA: serine hydrolase [Stellaceae bacterium]|nr:serine hydrolase [Stellaceae bacterium]
MQQDQAATAATDVRQEVQPGEARGVPGHRISRRTLYKPAVMLAAAAAMPAAASAEVATPGAGFDIESRVRALEPELERTVKTGMAAFDVPGAAVGIVAKDRLVYAKGFGRRRKGGNEPVGARTVFQIGSTTKAIGSATLAIAVDRGTLKWDDRVVDLYPPFALKDPYVTREFRVYDLFAQRSGLPPYANDLLSGLGFDPDWLVHSLRFVEPTTSFRSTFTYTNITHLIAGRIAAKALGAPDWPALATREIVKPLGMRDASFTAEAIERAGDHAVGHRWTPKGSVAIPFTPLFPYPLGPAGDINASVEDCARWVQFQLGNGSFAGRRLVSTENLAVTRTPKVSINEEVAYAMGWIVTDTPNGRALWHNGGTDGFGAQIGFLPHKGVGTVILTNQTNKGFPDAVGLWVFDKLLGNPETDYIKAALARAKDQAAKEAALYRKRAAPQPAPASDGLVGAYRSDMLGPATLTADGGGLLLTLQQTGARLRLAPFDGALFTVTLMPEGRFAPVAAGQGDEPSGFAGFEADAEGRLSRLRWTTEGQTFLWQKE